MRVAVSGSGYVGLVAAACLAEVGNQVCCVDIDQARVAKLTRGEVPIFEPGLTPIVQRNLANGHLRFTSDAAEAVAHGKVLFIAVGTPQDEDGSADLQYVEAVARTIGAHLDHEAVVVDKSTVPVGTADHVTHVIKQELEKRGAEIRFEVVSNPEFLKEGAAVGDFMKPDRIVLGVESDWAAEIMRTLYHPFNRNHDKLMVMDTRSAELTKYAANAMLATKISFMNEMANIAEQVGADIEMVRRGIGSDPRIGYSFIYPGAGYGGSCFPKDVTALNRLAEQHAYESQLVRAVDDVNQRQKRVLLDKVLGFFGNDIRGKTIALWGLAFKPNTDDMREAPSRVLMEGLWAAGAKVKAFDPEAMKEGRRLYPDQDGLTLCDSADEAAQDADALVVITEWKAFWSPDFDLLKQQLRQPVIFDGRNIYQPDYLQQQGFRYFAIGRGERLGEG
jgi:UDPglucose 6-dehydrogenase